MVSHGWERLQNGLGWCWFRRRRLRRRDRHLLRKPLVLQLGSSVLRWERWSRLLRVGRGRALGHPGDPGLWRPPSFSWLLIICEVNTRGQLGSPHRLLPSDSSPPSTPTETANRIIRDHLPSSAPPKSPLCSGERLRLTPRGLFLGAMTGFDGVGSTDTRRSRASVSYSFTARRVNPPGFPMTGFPQRVAVAGTSPIEHRIGHSSEIYVKEKYNTRSVQRCWIDGTRPIDHIASHAIHRS